MKKKVEVTAEYYLYFMMYAILGWCYEVFLEVVVYRWGFSNRGVLFGPYCPVYGVGALAFLFTVYRLIKGKERKRKLLMIPVVFLLCMLLATAIELVTSYICEAVMGSWPWQTYADYTYNFQARIALSPSLRFGLGGVLFLYVLQPMFEKVVGRIGNKKIVIACVIGCIFLVDIIFVLIE